MSVGISLKDAIFIQYRNSVFIPLSLATSTLALRPDSTILPIIIMLSALKTYTPFIFRPDEPRRFLKIAALGLATSIGSMVGRLHASREALSSKTQSFLMLFALSSTLSSISLGTLWASTKLSTRLPSSWSQLLLFPALWATVWWALSYVSPFGYLSTWNVGDNADAYNWIVHYLGPTGKNWIIGAWAIVLSQTITAWYMAHKDDLEDGANSSDGDNSKNRTLLGAFLIFLALPSFYIDPLPLPISEVDKTTPVTVGCAIPTYKQYKRHHPTLEDYITESNKLRSLGAKIILWPEGAVEFRNPKEKGDAFNAVREKVTGPYIGISFEETISNPSDPDGQAAMSRTGIAVISQHSDEPYLIYYKRNLVPCK